MQEIWKPVPGYEGYYEVSSLGRIRSIDRCTKNRWGSETFHRSQVMKCRIFKNGYAHVKLTKDGKRYEPSVHRLVAIAFIPNPNELPQVNHIDGDKANNTVQNLEWCTGSENQLHSRRVLNRVCGLPRKAVMCLETGITYESSHHAARAMKLNPGGIYRVCEGVISHTGGMHFTYIQT